MTPPPPTAGKKKRLKDEKRGPAGKDATKEEKDRYGSLEIHGRLFVRSTLARDEYPGPPVRQVDSLELTLPTARIGFEYRTPLKWLSVELEVELTGRLRLKDAFARARERYFEVKVGHFKVPISALMLESRYGLPTADRGRVHDLLTDVLQVGDRRVGVGTTFRDRDRKSGLRPSLVLGAFQGSKLEEGEFTEIENETLRGQTLAARARIEPGDFAFGASYQSRVGPDVALQIPEGQPPRLARPVDCQQPCTAHYFTVGVDAVLDTEFSTTGLRIWLDGLAGRSFLEHPSKRLGSSALDPTLPVFLSGRAVAAYRFGGTSRRALYVEPYGMAGVLDPDTTFGQDCVWEWALGVNVGSWKLARLGLEGQLVRAEPYVPPQLATEPERMALLVQGAVTF